MAPTVPTSVSGTVLVDQAVGTVIDAVKVSSAASSLVHWCYAVHSKHRVN